MTSSSLTLLLGVFVLFMIEAMAILLFLEGDETMGFAAIAVIVAFVLIVWRWKYATRSVG